MPPIEDVRRFLREFMGPADTPVARRIEQAKAFADAVPIPHGVSIQAAERAGVKVEWVIPAGAAATPVFLHLHGGGYVMGDPAGSRAFTTELALQTGARVLSVDYGLAPADPFPRAVEDALSVYRSLIEVGVPPRGVAVGGESAGGGLAVALLLAIRDAGLPQPSCAALVSPWSNLTCEGESYGERAASDPLLTRGVLLEMAATYLAGADPRDALASPGLADLTGLPPLLIQVGSDEVLLSDAQALAERAGAAGVAAELEVWKDMIHVWPMFHADLAEGRDAIAAIAAFVDRHWTRT